MAVPHITQLPPPPSRATDSKDVFTAKADAVLAAQQQFVAQTNALGDYVEQRAGSAESAAGVSAASAGQAADSAVEASQQVSAAAEQVTLAAQQVGLASEQVGLAELEADRAEAAQEQAEIAAAAAGAAAGLPALAGQAGRFMQVLPDESGVKWGVSQQEIGDALITSRVPGPDYLPADGGIFLQSAYPELFDIVGAAPDSFGTGWTQRAAVGVINNIPFTITKGVFAFLGASGNYRSVDGGVTWATLPAPAFGPLTVATNYAGIALALAVTTPTSLLRTTDAGLTWGSVATSFTADTNFPELEHDGNNGWFRFANSASLGQTVLNRSFDNGSTWGANILLGVTGLTNAACDGSGTWLCVGPSSTAVRRSTDNGSTWAAAAGLTAAVTGNSSTQAIATDGKGSWVVSAPAGTIFRSDNNGSSWARINSGLPTDSDTLRVIYDRTADIFVLCNRAAGVAVSSDGGKSWAAQPTTAIANYSGRLLSDGEGSFLLGVNGEQQYQTSAPAYGYDKNTQFRTPRLSVGNGASAYIKAKEVI